MPNLLPAGLLARLIEESQDAVIVIDDRGVLRYLNPAAATLCGHAAGALAGKPLGILLPPAVASHHQGFLHDFLTNEAPSQVLGRVREFTLLHASGEEIPIELKAVDLGLAEGTHYFGAFMGDLRERRRMEKEHTKLLNRLQQQALSDTLTGLPNRRAFQAQGQQLSARVHRSGEPAIVAVADIDHFKSVNDRFGHAAGDMVLTTISGVIRAAARGADIIGRLGGEEFDVLFPATTAEQAREVAERIRAAVQATQVQITPETSISLTISIGLAPFDGDLKGGMALADAALYRAKHQGRNRVEVN